MNDHESLAQWLQEAWKPEDTDPQSFEMGLTQRAQVHRRRRLQMTGVVVMSFVAVGGLWAAWNIANPDTTPTVETANATETTPTDSDAFWASALTDSEDNEAIPSEYEALSGFFLAGT